MPCVVVEKKACHGRDRTQESGGQCSSITKKLARIGSAGRHPQNAERDLFRALELPIESRLTIGMFFVMF